MTRLSLMACAAAVLTLTACNQAEAPATPPATETAAAETATPGQPQMAPAFTLVDSEGTERSLADFRGKTVVVEWTNEGCPYVQKHYSGAMQALQTEAVADDVVWLTIISSEPGAQGYVEGEEARAWKTRNEAGPRTCCSIQPERSARRSAP